MALFRAIPSLASAIALMGCAATPVPPSEAQPVPKDRLLAFQSAMPDKTAKLTVVRDTAAVGGMCYMGFYINGILAARIDGGEKASFLVEPGEAILRLTWDPHAGPICNAKDRWIQRETQLRANEEKNFRLSVDPGGTLDVIRSDL